MGGSGCIMFGDATGRTRHGPSNKWVRGEQILQGNANSDASFSPTDIRPPQLIANSGSSSNFATLDLPVTNKRPTMHHITIQLPNGDLVHVNPWSGAYIVLCYYQLLVMYTLYQVWKIVCYCQLDSYVMQGTVSHLISKDCMYILHHGLCILFGSWSPQHVCGISTQPLFQSPLNTQPLFQSLLSMLQLPSLAPHSAKLVALHATLISPTLSTPELMVLSPALSTLETGSAKRDTLTNFPGFNAG